MRVKQLLAAFLLAVGLCLVSALGYGEVETWLDESKASLMDLGLVDAGVRYIMAEPDSFLRVSYHYDSLGRWAENFPVGVSTRGKIVILIIDNRNVFSHKSGKALSRQFEMELFSVYYFIQNMATDMDNDIVVEFANKQGKTLGYFYQGEYHLWER